MKTLPSLLFGSVVVLLGLGLMLLFSQPWLVFGALMSFTKSVKVRLADWTEAGKRYLANNMQEWDAPELDHEHKDVGQRNV